MWKIVSALVLATMVCSCSVSGGSNKAGELQRETVVSIVGDSFYVNGSPTFEGRYWRGYKIEGLLPNSRMVQGVFDDLNPRTAANWRYPDTNEWDAERNTREFVEAMEEWYAHGLLGFTINMQGGSPKGYGNRDWYNSSFHEDGSLRKEYMKRLEKILDRADEIGMVPILGIFYFGQDQNLRDDDAVRTALDHAVNWLHEKGYRNVLIEVANECDNRKYDREAIKKANVARLIRRVQANERNGHRFLVGVSFNGGQIPPDDVIEASDFILIHGNGVKEPDRIVEMVKTVRGSDSYTGKPIVFNEDDHYDFEKEWNNFVAATSVYASWGYFDWRRQGEAFENGYQSVPVSWGITSDRKRAFFALLKEMTSGDK